jgi:phage FluMu protein Com
MEGDTLNEYRCNNCGKLLSKGNLKECTIEIKCRRCGEIKVFGCNNVNGLKEDENLQ